MRLVTIRDLVERLVGDWEQSVRMSLAASDLNSG
jgi:hypothetical protein